MPKIATHSSVLTQHAGVCERQGNHSAHLYVLKCFAVFGGHHLAIDVDVVVCGQPAAALAVEQRYGHRQRLGTRGQHAQAESALPFIVNRVHFDAYAFALAQRFVEIDNGLVEGFGSGGAASIIGETHMLIGYVHKFIILRL